MTGIQECFSLVTELLNHDVEQTAVSFYIDPRLLAAWCCKNNIKKDQLNYHWYLTEGWVITIDRSTSL